MREIEEQGRDGDPLVHHHPDIRIGQGVGLAPQRTDPEIGATAWIDPLRQIVADLALPVADNMDALRLIRFDAWEIDVHQDIAGPPYGDGLADDVRSPMKG